MADFKFPTFACFVMASSIACGAADQGPRRVDRRVSRRDDGPVARDVRARDGGFARAHDGVLRAPIALEVSEGEENIQP